MLYIALEALEALCLVPKPEWSENTIQEAPQQYYTDLTLFEPRNRIDLCKVDIRRGCIP